MDVMLVRQRRLWMWSCLAFLLWAAFSRIGDAWEGKIPSRVAVAYVGVYVLVGGLALLVIHLHAYPIPEREKKEGPQ